MPLLDIESTRFLALRALTLVTQQGGAPIRVAIALRAPALTKLIDTCPTDPLLHDLVISTLSHTVGVATEGDEGSPTYPKVLKQLDMPKILNTTIHCITQPSADSSCIGHGIELITNSTLQASAAYKKTPEAIKILVAGLRAQDWGTRAMCLGALMRMNKLGSENDVAQLDPNRMIRIVQSRSTPDNLIEVMFDYGLARCDMYMTMNATRDFTMAIMEYPKDLNLYSLGLKLAKCIVSTEFSIADGYYETLNEKTGRREPLDMGLPFHRYTDSLPLCAKAIRERTKNPQELDAADVLDIKFKIMRQRVGEAADQARRGLERNPQFAYFHYALSLRADPTSGLRSAKQGMKCRDITPFIKYQLMQRAVEHSAELGLQTLQKVHLSGGGMEDEQAREEKLGLGIAFLQSALEDEKTFLAEAPPDNRYKKNVGYWCVLLTIVVSEHVSPTLKELKVCDKLASEMFAAYISLIERR